MAKILSHPRVYSFLHVPVQSASDNVLADMKREYSVDDFMHVVDFLKERYGESQFLLLVDTLPAQPSQCWQLSQIIRETVHVLPVFSLESEISRIIAEVCYFL